MSGFLADMYPWIKAFHIMSVIAWMAGMFYLPRLYVYHAEAKPGSEQSETFKVMERRLLRGIINPAMIMTFLFGVLLLSTPGIVDWSAGWIWIKITMLVIMGAFHGSLSRWRRDFDQDKNTKSSKFYRYANEVPTLLMVVIVIMAVVKPF
ncbi:protoporphyrinogen oxidase HemJ [Sneathiella chinensis]|uniref:Protoporphyrinogen IX oxidase n=1 Tax=Sneathiella chinensis TaxID=349750 RepID=A0ABQ5TZW5_9PROT|nr:protoporphyrinogen oxidase HemJ [Sneathiella chinensis]GLQ04940.1 membrane protein [Sneathiella chinensis]